MYVKSTVHYVQRTPCFFFPSTLPPAGGGKKNTEYEDGMASSGAAANNEHGDGCAILQLPYHDRRRADTALVLVDKHIWAKLGDRNWQVTTNKITGEDSYVVCGVDSVYPRSLHREAYLLQHGSIPLGYKVDHRNFVRTDCRLANLRECSSSMNACHRNKPQKRKAGAAPPTSRYKGVWRKKPRVLKDGKLSEESKPWVCEVSVQGKGKKHTSTHATEADAAKKYNEISKQWMGEYAVLNQV